MKTIISSILRAFNRRYEHAKIANPVNRINGDALVRTTSRLQIKREMSLAHINARRYKRAFRGVTGALTWSDFNRMSLRGA